MKSSLLIDSASKGQDSEVARNSQPRKRGSGNHILVVCTQLPKPDANAGDVRFFELLKMLRAEFLVDLCALQLERDPSLAARLCGNLTDISINFLGFETRNFLTAVSRERYDVVFCEFWYTARAVEPAIRRLQPWAKVVIDSVDVHYLREEAGLALGYGEADLVRWKKERELESYRRADQVIVVTREDHQALDSVGGIRNTLLVPLVIPKRPITNAPKKKELLFVGGFKHPPNQDGILWFIQQVFPAVKKRIPDVVLTVVGSHPTPEILAQGTLPGIQIVGYVPDTAPYLERASVSVAPLRFGAGMKGKVTEAMAAGLPVVTTSIGAQGLNVISGEQLLIADEPTAFAESIISLISSSELARRVGQAGQDYIEKLCGYAVVSDRLLGGLDRRTKPVGRMSFWRWRVLSMLCLGFIGVKGALIALGAKRLKQMVLRKSAMEIS